MPPAPLRLARFLPYRLATTTALVSERIASAYSALFDLTIPEWRVIAVTAEQDGISQQGIVAATRMDKVTVSRAAIALSRRGLLVRQEDTRDRRSRLLALSAAGRELYANVAPKALELERSIFEGFSADELAAFVATLSRIDAILLPDESAGPQVSSSPVGPTTTSIADRPKCQPQAASTSARKVRS